MTDTGRIPGEGQPENAGAPQEEPDPSAPVGYTYAPPTPVPADLPHLSQQEQDDLLLMPSAQGAWGDPGQPVIQPIATQPRTSAQQAPAQQAPAQQAPAQQAPAQPTAVDGLAQDATGATDAQGTGTAGAEAYAAPAAHLPEGHEANGRDSGVHDYSAVRTPAAGSPVPGLVRPVAHEGTVAEPSGAPAGSEQPTEGGQENVWGAPDPASRPAAQAPAPQPKQPPGGGATPRRPLHLGPPVPEQSGAVRSLAERGPSQRPGTPNVGPVETGGQVVPEAQTAPALGDEQGGATEPEYLDVPAQTYPTPQSFQDPAQLPGPQLGALPPQPGAWSPQPAPAETVGHPGEHPLSGPDLASEPESEPGAPEPRTPASAGPEAADGSPVEPRPLAGGPSVPDQASSEQATVEVSEAPPAAPFVPHPVSERPVSTQPASAQSAEDEAARQKTPSAGVPRTVAAEEGHPLASEQAEGAPAPVDAEESVDAGQAVPGAGESDATARSVPAPRAGHAADQTPEPNVAQDAPQPPTQTAPQAVAVPEEQQMPDQQSEPPPNTVAPVAEPTDAQGPRETPPADAVAAQPPTPAEEPAAKSATQSATPDAEVPEPVTADSQPVAEATSPEATELAADSAEAATPPSPPAPGYSEADREAVHRAMRERRDVRNGFRGDPIPHEVLLRVLEAAHTAPSVGHSQPWDFVIIRSAETRQTMHELAIRQREAYAKTLPKARAKQFKELKVEAILDTPVNIVVTADPTRGGRHTLGRHSQPQTAPYSSALAVENLWLAARAEGLGVGWVSFFDEREMVRELGLPEHLEVVAYLCVGYVDAFPEEPELVQSGWSKRRPLSWVVHEESYGRRVLPGAEPHDLLSETLGAIRPLDAKALGEAWERQKRMTKPAGALGMLEIISAQLSGLARQCPPPVPEPAAVAVFAGDHGVHAQQVTAWPQEVTAQMVGNFLGGGAVCNAFAQQVGAEVCVVDVGVAGQLPQTQGLLPRKVRPGTADFSTTAAMTRQEALRAVEVGIETARDLVAAGNKALLTGEMGIANTTVSAALISVYTGADPVDVTGRGTGISDEMHGHKAEVVRRALELHQVDPTDPLGVLAALGGLEHAALVGLILGGASLRTPVVLDGVSAGAAALVARAMAPEALAACIAGHRSPEPGHHAALTTLGLRPLIDLDLRLGEGTGALLALPVVQSAARAMHDVATFDAAGVTEKN